MSKVFAGVGARSTPTEIQFLMSKIAAYLREKNYWLRTGAADGADLAFASGAKDKTIYYLPWLSYNSNKRDFYSDKCIIGSVSPSLESIDIAKKLHPAPDKCSDSVWKMHGRNCHIINGANLNSPSKFVILWTPEGKRVGGTAMAWAYADTLDIPVINLYDFCRTPVENWFNKVLEAIEIYL